MKALQFLLYARLRLLHYLARHLLYQVTPVLFAYRAELLLLLLIQERGDFGVDFVGDLLQLLQLLLFGLTEATSNTCACANDTITAASSRVVGLMPE